ncbi:hypothetical protein BN863_28880 [Formosa agariphila KMM 3901]|uniref:Uncharacterized protein n=1 Tax=Formosa agariphila (strain DSM 15362 / KCTC 12365 / LMG 23005 / KMM 3901 / M-2Alg 35-1) TaxID=1347342 RepID=T2KPB2_FORAG|nr:hypothetical protein [Formosa agariphila]CDF80600.1 hypothetical protein BN863_28880 [Formosa agariphila KMM 3901]
MLNFVLAIGAILLGLALFGLFILKYRFSLDDLDPFSYNNEFYTDLAPESRPKLPESFCKHLGEKTDVIINSTVTCETIQTICDDCGTPIKERTECL